MSDNEIHRLVKVAISNPLTTGEEAEDYKKIAEFRAWLNGLAGRFGKTLDKRTIPLHMILGSLDSLEKAYRPKASGSGPVTSRSSSAAVYEKLEKVDRGDLKKSSLVASDDEVIPEECGVDPAAERRRRMVKVALRSPIATYPGASDTRGRR